VPKPRPKAKGGLTIRQGMDWVWVVVEGLEHNFDGVILRCIADILRAVRLPDRRGRTSRLEARATVGDLGGCHTAAARAPRTPSVSLCIAFDSAPYRFV
jgi:hypothetical protein